MPTAGDSKKSPTAPCPQCKQAAGLGMGNPWRPFCSQRCKLLDLGEWFSGRYTLPADEDGQGSGPDQDDGNTLQ